MRTRRRNMNIHFCKYSGKIDIETTDSALVGQLFWEAFDKVEGFKDIPFENLDCFDLEAINKDLNIMQMCVSAQDDFKKHMEEERDKDNG